MSKICVLTSGGDAPGMNAAIRAVVRSSLHYKIKVVGSERGYQGLIDGHFKKLGFKDVANIIQQGGTILRSARSEEFRTQQGQQIALNNLRAEGVQGVVVIGGDGSFMGAKVLSELGMPTIGIPGTIDNDLAYTDYTLGFDTACNTIVDAINKLRDTMESHERVIVLEVMGRHCGDLALYAGVAGGAKAILVPEVPLKPEEIVSKIKERQTRANRSGDANRRSFLMVVAEGVAGGANGVKDIIKAHGDFSVRTVVLGHTQRGGSPSTEDRLLATKFGCHAVALLKSGQSNRIVGIKDNKVIDMDIKEGLSQNKVFDRELYDMSCLMAGV
ncbi:MAG: 6-phosphofructokinase [Clostridiales bacterium]|nr:6-phosphofructokinase [Clostridiales bacterium]